MYHFWHDKVSFSCSSTQAVDVIRSCGSEEVLIYNIMTYMYAEVKTYQFFSNSCMKESRQGNLVLFTRFNEIKLCLSEYQLQKKHWYFFSGK
jgi:hypothetical protein